MKIKISTKNGLKVAEAGNYKLVQMADGNLCRQFKNGKNWFLCGSKPIPSGIEAALISALSS